MSEYEARIIMNGIKDGTVGVLDLMRIAQDYECWADCAVSKSAERIREHRYQQVQIDRHRVRA